MLSDVTVSPRIGRKGGEPVFTDKIDVEVLDGTRIQDDVMILHARCSDCRVWPNGFLDATAPHQPMIYAFGARYALQSSSSSANLKRHVRYGHFTMDMTAATGTGGIPLKSNASSGVEELGAMTKDMDRKTLAHAISGCIVLFVVWPLNVLIAGFMKNVRIHVGFSMAVVLALGVVYGLGISTSNQYNRVSLCTRAQKTSILIQTAVQSIRYAPPDPRIHHPRSSNHTLNPPNAAPAAPPPSPPTPPRAFLQPHPHPPPRLRRPRSAPLPAIPPDNTDLHRPLPPLHHMPHSHQLHRAAPRICTLESQPPTPFLGISV